MTTIFEMLKGMEDALRPPERLTVSQAAAKYRMLNNPGAYIGPWKNDTAPYLTEIMDTLDSREYTACVLAASAQCGKALALDTPIPTPDGWTTMGELTPGAQLFDENGTVCRVTFATPVMHDHQCYRIEFDDGSTIVADADHKWAVDDVWSNKRKVLTTLEMLPEFTVMKSDGKRLYRFTIPNTSPLDLPEAGLLVDPYVLGVWLGDGNSDGGTITAHRDDIETYAARFEAAGHECRIRHDTDTVSRLLVDPRDGEAANFCLRGHDKRVVGVASNNCCRECMRQHWRKADKGVEQDAPTKWTLGRALSKLGVIKNKHIPAQYLRASKEQRFELLRGLMDTDGCVDERGRCTFSASNERLAKNVEELLYSLGFKTRITTRIPKAVRNGVAKPGKLSYQMCFSAYAETPVFHLERKRVRQKKDGWRGKSQRRRIVDIRKVDSVPVRCIQVDSPSHLFLAGEQMVPTHNTDSILNWLLHTVICSPADFILYQTSQSVARDFSKRRVERLHRHSPAMKERLSPRSDDNNVFDLKYRSGMLFTLSWPTINELSGRPVGRVALTDYDRMPENVDGEGSPFDLARTRTRTFGSFAMTFAESSPGFEVERASWVPSTPHEAPPTKGILALYNRGDRRRWYWPCVHCGEFYEPDFHLLVYPDTTDIIEAAEQAKMACPHCGGMMDPGDKAAVNRRGVWLKDGQRIRADGTVVGEGPRSDIASFWLKGVAAAFADWKTLVTNYLKAVQEFERTGSQEALKSTVNTDQGLPYLPRGLGQERLPEELKGRATALPQAVVPEGVRFLNATVDVQANRFSVQVTGTLAGGDKVVIDRFEIIKSQRYDEDGERLWLKPGAYPEDWEVLIPQVLDRSYPLGDGSGRRMMLRMVGCDSGGKGGTTANAYAFYRRLKRDGKHKRFRLIKGTSNEAAPRAAIGYPDAQKKDKLADARGDIPVLFLQVNKLKDQLNNMLDRTEPGGGMVIFADWLPDEFFTELTVEVRTPKGWENPKKYRNEAWDHLVYDLGLCSIMRADNFDWDNPPTWAGEWDGNPLVFGGEESRFEAKAKETYDLAKLGAALA